MVLEEGRNPTVEHFVKLGLAAEINKRTISTIIEQTQDALSQWLLLAKIYDVSQNNIKLIGVRIN